MSTEENKRRAEALIPRFQFERVLNHDEAGRRITLYGRVGPDPGADDADTDADADANPQQQQQQQEQEQPALLILERAPFPDALGYLAALPASLRGRVTNLGNNDVYSWFLGSSNPGPGPGSNGSGGEAEAAAAAAATEEESEPVADLKLSLICPCTDKHVRKHSRQGYRTVTETPAIYHSHVRPYMAAARAGGRLNWVYNIIEGTREASDVIYRTPLGRDVNDEGFLLLPNLHWDRRTVEALHLLAVVERRDLWSLRDLRRKHVPWLRRMRARLVSATVATYGAHGLEADQLKLFFHYQPTYYHLHVHVVHVMLEAGGATQSVGKAVGLDAIIEQLEGMAGEEDGETGMDTLALSYTVGEASDLWTDVFEPLKKKAAAAAAAAGTASLPQ
ncbi:HIT-like domain-containing protein [Xylariaceae sp. FL0804]|nr:HIT-like domain-containing protein [Xylariaceae sp. FL0804]